MSKSTLSSGEFSMHEGTQASFAQVNSRPPSFGVTKSSFQSPTTVFGMPKAAKPSETSFTASKISCTSKTVLGGLQTTTRRKFDPVDDKLIIGLDFGTTYTGIAYGFTSDPSTITVIKEWPGKSVRGRNDIVKIPTVIKYGEMKDDDPEIIDFDWGYEVSDKAKDVIRGFKLGLDPKKRKFYAAAVGIGAEDDIIHYHEQTTSEELNRIFKNTVDIVADFIGAVYKHAMTKIRERELLFAMESIQKQFVLTVPAIWSDMAKNATLRAARQAHADILVNPEDMVTEPEAAALYTFQFYQKRGLSGSVRIGDVFVLCDAGGGTVDLISYQVAAVRPKLQLKEVVKATGGAVGSMMINNGFERHLRTILGEEVMAELKADGSTVFNDIMRDFDQKVKPNFSSAKEWDDEGIYDTINLSGAEIEDDEDNNIRKNTLKITGDVLESIFNPLVVAIEGLVQEQIDGVVGKELREPTAIFLVGGFGSSPYLSRRLQEMTKTIPIVKPEEAWSAVVKGAVLYKMPGTVEVVSSCAPTNLGVRANVPYNKLEHPESAANHKIVDEHEGVERIPKMTWYIYKDTELKRNDAICFPFFRDIPFDYRPDNLVFEDELEESDEDIPPMFPWEKQGVRKKVVLKSDLRGLSVDDLEEREGPDGSKYYSVHYNLVVSIESAGMEFYVECKDKMFSVTDVDY
ncbi:hypothetical protein DL768_011143 [Monosporascus sp. mg162]|nr:hypothetical protein DL768_011143 [Monosporascus sp. mg162]